MPSFLFASMELDIRIFGEAVLRTHGQEVTSFDSNLASLARDMLETMYREEGIGLAAQQVGRTERICVVDLRGCMERETHVLDGSRPPLDLIMPMVLVNPEVLHNEGPTLVMEEGCLSFPGLRGDIPRIEKVVVRYQDLDGMAHQLEADGLFGRCLLHEIDHLNGVLFVDRMVEDHVKALQPALRQLKKKTLRK